MPTLRPQTSLPDCLLCLMARTLGLACTFFLIVLMPSLPLAAQLDGFSKLPKSKQQSWLGNVDVVGGRWVSPWRELGKVESFSQGERVPIICIEVSKLKDAKELGLPRSDYVLQIYSRNHRNHKWSSSSLAVLASTPHLSIEFIEIDDEALLAIASLPELESLEFKMCKFETANLGLLKMAAGLKHLYLYECKLAPDLVDKAADSLASVRQLRSLKISGSWSSRSLNLEAFENLQMLSIVEHQAQPDTSKLRTLKSLRELRIWAGKLDNAFFDSIACLEALQTLQLSSCLIQPHSKIRAPDQLQTLRIIKSELNSASFEGLANLSSLSALEVSNTQFAGTEFGFLERLPALTHVNFSETGANDKLVESLVQAKSLTDLDLRKTQITDNALERIGRLENLRRLDLARTRITDAGLEHLRGLSSLEELDLSSTQIAGTSLADFQSLPQLRRLCLAETNVGDDQLIWHQNAPKLAELNLRGSQLRGDKENVFAGKENLRVLNLGDCQIGDSIAAPLSKLGRLQFLFLDATNVTHKGLQTLAGSKEFKELKELTLGEIDYDWADIQRRLSPDSAPKRRDASPSETDLMDAVLSKFYARKVRIIHHPAQRDSVGKLSESSIEEWKSAGFQIQEFSFSPNGLAVSRWIPEFPRTDVESDSLSDNRLPGFSLIMPRKKNQFDLPPPREPFGLELMGCELTEEDLSRLGQMENLTALFISPPNGLLYKDVFCDGRFQNLRHLTLNAENFEIVLREATTLQKLESLSVGFQSAPSDYSFLSNFPALRAIQMGTANDDTLKALANLPNLTAVGLNGTKITDRGLSELRNLGDLRELWIDRTKISGSGLGELSKLEILSAQNTNMNDESVKVLSKLTNLKTLDFDSQHLTNSGFAELGKLESLRKLKLSGLSINNETIEALLNLQELEELNLDAPRANDAGVAKLAGFKKLKRLTLFTGMTPDVRKSLQKALPNCEIFP